MKTHMERDRDDPRYIVTTYYGVHNHAVPGSGAPAAPGGGAVERARRP